MSTATSLVRVVLRSAAEEGVAADALLGPVGLDPGVVEDRDARVPTAPYLATFARAVELTGNPALGARAAAALDTAAFGLLGFVLASCPTLRTALVRLSTYARLLCDELSVQLAEREDGVAVVYAMDAAPYVPALFEMAFTHLIATARRGTSGAFRPRCVRFRQPRGHRSLARSLGAPVELGAVEDAVVCDARALDLPLRGANPTLLGILDAHATHVLSTLPDETDPLAGVRAAVQALLPRGEPSLEAVASRLGLGARTLQRRLRDRGLTFREIIDQTRRECALIQLANPEVSVAEVAFSLGFSGPSAFHHAFRRWTGRSPGQRG